MSGVTLGIHDLTTDEAFIVLLFRVWRCMGPTRAVAEHKIACELQKRPIYFKLDLLFSMFAEFEARSPTAPERVAQVREGYQHELLSSTEEKLLDLFATPHSVLTQTDAGSAGNRDRVSSIGLITRLSASIERSGRDAALLRKRHRNRSTR